MLSLWNIKFTFFLMNLFFPFDFAVPTPHPHPPKMLLKKYKERERETETEKRRRKKEEKDHVCLVECFCLLSEGGICLHPQTMK